MAVLMISATKLIKDTALGGSVDNDLLHPYILLAQDKNIFPYLGTDLYTKIKNDITAGSVTGAYQTLLNEYIQPALVQYSFAELLPVLRIRFVNHSIVAMGSEQGSSVSYEEIKPIISSTRANADFYAQRMIDYIKHNLGSFPEYQTNSGADLQPTVRNYSQGMNLDVGYQNPKLRDFLQGANITIYD
jgi:hypothetical protein